MNANNCTNSCLPKQVISILTPINDVDTLKIIGACDIPYDNNSIEFAYSMDNVCWSCYMSFDEMTNNTLDMVSDFFVRALVSGPVIDVTHLSESLDFTKQLYNGFSFVDHTSDKNSNMYNPYINMDCALALQQSMTETVSNLFGIPIYYFKVSGDANAKDITFKEYALSHVTSVKQIKLIVTDGNMPSSKPEFSDWGLDWQSDWETEISKMMFATAFGNSAQPMEGDLVYIPMMKRMWRVSSAYEEKKDALMWNATSFKVGLVKYQQDSSVDLADASDIIDGIVKNTYGDLFNEVKEKTPSGIDAAFTHYNYDTNLYPVFMSDALRNYVSCDSVDTYIDPTYYRSTQISDNAYKFTTIKEIPVITYQNKLCAESFTISCIMKFDDAIANYETDFLTIGLKRLHIKQDNYNVEFTMHLLPDFKFEFKAKPNTWYFVVYNIARELNSVMMTAYEYKFPENIPLYKLTKHHYYYDIDHPVATKTVRWNEELKPTGYEEIELHGFKGSLTNFKVFDTYNDNISEVMMQYPNNSHLIINDTARKLIGGDAISK